MNRCMAEDVTLPLCVSDYITPSCLLPHEDITFPLALKRMCFSVSLCGEHCSPFDFTLGFMPPLALQWLLLKSLALL
ncbi:uncharacterized [Tachysurus ichikawai]